MIHTSKITTPYPVGMLRPNFYSSVFLIITVCLRFCLPSFARSVVFITDGGNLMSKIFSSMTSTGHWQICVLKSDHQLNSVNL